MPRRRHRPRKSPARVIPWEYNVSRYARSRTVQERFGTLHVRLRLDADDTGVTMTPLDARWQAIPLPVRLFRIAARETACASPCR